MKNFKVQILTRDGQKHFHEFSGGQIKVYQRESMDKYAEKHLKVQCIVRPSARLETRAVMNSFHFEMSHAIMHETDPVKSPMDWLTRPDDYVYQKMTSSIKNKRYKVKKRR